MRDDAKAVNDVDLADFLAVLFRWKGFVFFVTICFGALGLAASVMMTKKYEVTSILEIAQIRSDKDYRYVESPEAAAERLKGIAKRVYFQAQAAADQAMGFSVQNDFRVKASKLGGLVEIELQTPREQVAIEFMQSVTAGFVRDHDRILQIEKQRIETEIENVAGQLAEYKGKKLSLTDRMKALTAEEQFLRRQIEAAGEQIDRILEVKLAAGINTKDEPLGQLLFANEMHRIQAHIDELSQRLMSEIPRDRDTVSNRLEELEAGIRKASSNLEMAQVQLSNLIETTVLLPPDFSFQPTSPHTKLNVALGLVTGLLLSVLFSFLLDFLMRNRKKIKTG